MTATDPNKVSDSLTTEDMLDRARVDRPIRSMSGAGACRPLMTEFAPDRTLALRVQFRTELQASTLTSPFSGSKLHLRRIAISILLALATLCAGASSAFLLGHFWDSRRKGLSDRAIQLVVEGIIKAESGGNSRAQNPRSTATGAGQFIESTWLELARKHLPNVRDRTDAEVLQLRYHPQLSRAMTAHLVRRNAKILRDQGLVITPGALYLAHFAGGAGAAAVLLAPHDADAALTMARADPSGRTSRERLVKANPFLEGMTTSDLKTWAEQRLRRHVPSENSIRHPFRG
jgi:hypothetical protein